MKRPKRHRTQQPHYLLRETDLERIDGLIACLNLAISEIFHCRQILEPPQQDMPAAEDFTAQVELIVHEANLQMSLPGIGASDF
jgi:hypothetical protein